MGDRIVIPDEEVIEPEVEPETEAVPPTFADILQASPVVRDQASSWVLPKVIIGSAALLEIVVVPDLFLTNVITYDARS